MPPASQIIDFEGYFAEGVLGIFRIIRGFADELFVALADVLTRMTSRYPSLCQTYAFLELAAPVWRESSGDSHDAKVNAAVSLLDRIGLWLGDEGITGLLNPLSPAKQLLETFKAAQQRVPKRVFLGPLASAPGCTV